MEVIKLEHFHNVNISDETLKKLHLVPKDFTDIDRQTAWKRYISGSKIKQILETPVSLLSYYMGWITALELEKDLRVIPRMNYYRDYGSLMESVIVNNFNLGLFNEWKEDETLTSLRDILIDSRQQFRIRNMLAPNHRDKEYIKVDKRSFLLDIPEFPASSLFMANIDGFTLNPDGTIKHIVEVKTKTGGNGDAAADTAEIMKMHRDQICFYHHMFGATDGALLLVDHHSRGIKLHKFEQHELERRWAEIAPRIATFVSLYYELTKPQPNIDYALELVKVLEIGSPKKEVVQTQHFISMIKRLGGGDIYA